MSRGLRNWTFKKAVSFLTKHDFVHSHTRGSHFYYMKKDQIDKPAICIAFHGSKAIKLKTMRTIVAQSGIGIKEWLNKQ